MTIQINSAMITTPAIPPTIGPAIHPGGRLEPEPELELESAEDDAVELSPLSVVLEVEVLVLLATDRSLLVLVESVDVVASADVDDSPLLVVSAYRVISREILSHAYKLCGVLSSRLW